MQLGLHELDIEGDGDLVPNQNAAGLEGGIPGQAEVLPVDLCARRDRNPSVAPGIFRGWSWPFNRKADLVGNATDGQITFHRQFSLAHDVDARRLEVQGRELLHMKEIGALEVSIALVIAGVNGSSFNGGLQAMVRWVRFIPDKHARNFGE